MPQFPTPVNIDTVEPSRPGGTSPASIAPAWYRVVIEETTVEPTKKGPHALILNYRLKEGSAIGAVVREWLNLFNPNEQTRNIAESDLAAIGAAVGISGEISNSDVLHGRELDVKLVIGSNPNFRDVKGYAAAGTESATDVNRAAQAAPVVTPEQTQAQVAGAIAQPAAPAAVPAAPASVPAAPPAGQAGSVPAAPGWVAQPPAQG